MRSGGYSSSRRVLTRRMLDVLEAAASGEAPAQTARRLEVSVVTVYHVRAAVVARLEAPNFTAAVYRFGRGEAA